MYYVSKLVWLALEPSNALTFLVLVGLALCWSRRQRLGRALALVSGGMLLLLGVLPVSTLLLRPLENRFPIFVDDGRPVAGIIVLGGVLMTEVTSARGQLNVNESAERLMALSVLGKRYPEAKIAFTGGAGDLTGGPESEADALERVIGDILPGREVLFERSSRNTLENARHSREILKPASGERWLLVTSAWHMPRSMGIFRKAGWDVTAYPVDFRTSNAVDDYRLIGTVSFGLRRVDLAMKEYVGLLFAYLSGGSEVLWPGPEK